MSTSKLNRRHFLRMSGGVLGLAALAACAPAPAAAPATGGESAAAPAAEGLVSSSNPLWIINSIDFHPDYNAWLNAKMAAYAEEQGWPYELADMAGFTSGSGEVEKLAASVQAGDPPDLVNHTLSSIQLHNLDLLQPVSDLVAEVEAVFGDVAPYLAQTMILDGEWWALPYHQRTDGGYYHRDKFDEIGVDLQTVRTYSDLRDACLEVSRPDEEFYGWGMTVNRSGDGNFLINRIKTGYGAAWQDETGQYIRTNSPEMIDAMNFIKETYTDETWASMLPPGVLAWNDTANNEAYLGGVIAFTQNAGTVYAKAVIDGNPVAEVTNYLKPPGGPVNQEFMSLGSKNWYVLKGARNTEAARQLALTLTAELELQEEMLASSPAYAIPAYTNLWDMSEYIQGNEIALQSKPAALDDSGINATNWPGPPSPAIVAIDESGAWNDMVNSIITGTPVEEAVATAHERMVLIFQEYGLPGQE